MLLLLTHIAGQGTNMRQQPVGELMLMCLCRHGHRVQAESLYACQNSPGRSNAWLAAPGLCCLSWGSLWLPGTKRMQPMASLASDTASQQVAVAGSAFVTGQYAMSWCLHTRVCLVVMTR